MYFDSIREHVTEFSAHLNGSSSDSSTTFVPPSSYWTGPEKDAFFHALSVHSRHRVDLICSAVPTKSAFEVSHFLRVLERDSEKLPSLNRNSFPIAHQVSDTFIAWEEQEAQRIIALETEPGPSSSHPLAEEFNVITAEKLRYLHSILSLDSQFPPSHPSSAPLCLGAQSSSRVDNVAANSSLAPSNANTNPSLAFASLREDCVDTNTLSPASRRRYKKRLHMRQKRAATRGVEASVDFALLRRGRMRGKVSAKTPAVIYDSDEYLDGDETGRSWDKQELRTAEFAPLPTRNPSNVDTEKAFELARDNGLDILNLKMIQRLLGYNQIDSNGQSPVSISCSVFSLLHDILRQFLLHIMRLSLVLHQQDLAMKSSKVWKRRTQNEIDGKHVFHALHLAGYQPKLHIEPRVDASLRKSKSLQPPTVLPFPLELTQPNVSHLIDSLTPSLSLAVEPTMGADIDPLLEEAELQQERQLDENETTWEEQYELQLIKRFRITGDE